MQHLPEPATAQPQANQPPTIQLREIENSTLHLQGEHLDLYKILRGFHSFNRDQCAKLRDETTPRCLTYSTGSFRISGRHWRTCQIDQQIVEANSSEIVGSSSFKNFLASYQTEAVVD